LIPGSDLFFRLREPRIPTLNGKQLVGFADLGDRGARAMLTEFDQNTIASMTAALEYVCKKIPVDKDSHELRKQLGDAMTRAARSGTRTLTDFQNVGLQALKETAPPPRSSWLGRLFR
jgi:hypothetical protein